MKACPARRTSLLRHREDWRTLAFLAVILAILYLPVFAGMPWRLAALWLPVATFAAFVACIINHNHIHTPVFAAGWLNALLDLSLTAARGHTSQTVFVPHVLNHHRHHGAGEDWIRTGLAGGGPGAVRMARYVWAATLSMARERRRASAPVADVSRRRRQRYEWCCLALVIAVSVAVDPARSIVLVFLPWVVAMAMLVGVNLLQHDGCDPARPLGHSRNFTSALGNWLLFNNGYHTVHHERPSLHWSDLPATHAREYARRLPAGLTESSITLFLLRNYLFDRGSSRPWRTHRPARSGS